MKLTALRRRLALLLTNIESQSQQSAYFHEFHVSKQWGLWTDRTINPLTRNPQRFWSQADEDGIISKIFERMSISDGTFMEFGCGDGLQNNSLALIAKGWRGGWVDGSPLPYQISEVQHVVNFQNSWVTKENVSEFFENGLRDFVKNTNHVSLLSMDLDGNDYHFLESLFSSGKSADLVVLEYNARFPVGSKWIMPYNENHAWKGDDYFGHRFHLSRNCFPGTDTNLLHAVSKDLMRSTYTILTLNFSQISI